jgi:hypothetical protein
LGHIAVAKSLGYETELYYGSMTYYHKGYDEDTTVQKLQTLFSSKDSFEDFTEADREYERELLVIINEKFPDNKTHSFLMTLGGPVQTILTCFLRLFILIYRKSKKRKEFKLYDWIGIFLSLFVLREVFNIMMAGAKYLINGTNSFHGDEFRISIHLGFNQWTIPIITAIIGSIIAIYSKHIAFQIFSFFFFLFSALKFATVTKVMPENLCLNKRKNKSA